MISFVLHYNLVLLYNPITNTYLLSIYKIHKKICQKSLGCCADNSDSQPDLLKCQHANILTDFTEERNFLNYEIILRPYQYQI